MKRRSQPKHTKASGSYSAKMQSGNFMYGGYTNHLNWPNRPARRSHAK